MVHKALITGGTGFIGTHLSARLVRSGHEVTTLSRSATFECPEVISTSESRSVRKVAGDARDEGLLSTLVSQADTIFHKAAIINQSPDNAREMIDTNIVGTAALANVLKAGHHNVSKVILGSSISVYGEGNYICRRCGIVRPEPRISQDLIELYGDWNPRCPRCAEHVEPTDTDESVVRSGESVYAVTKKAQEDLLLAACRATKIPLITLRYCTVYGPGQSSRNAYVRLLRSMIDDRAAFINEDGRQSRDFIYIGDAVRACVLTMESSSQATAFYNIGSGVQTPLADFITLLRKELNATARRPLSQPVTNLKLVPGEIRHCYADCGSARHNLDFEGTENLSNGVRQFAASQYREPAC